MPSSSSLLLALLQAISVPIGSGSCIDAQGTPVLLRRVMFLENRELELDSSRGPVTLSIDGQRFMMRWTDPAANGAIRLTNVGEQVGRGATADVMLRLGLLEGRPVLYWRETFQNRQYRQGLFRIDLEVVAQDRLDALDALCEGSGGVWRSH